MKTIKFRPLRKDKKTGKVIVSSYMLWRNLKTADRSKFKLILSDDHLGFDKNALVHNHKGEVLFFYEYHPADMPTKPYGYFINEGINIKTLTPEFIKSVHITANNFYSVKGVDCDFVPTFTHYTIDYIAKHVDNMNGLEPLTVDTVLKWYWWIIYNLENSVLEK